MRWSTCAALLFVIFIAKLTRGQTGQDTTTPVIPDHLINCYKNQSVYHRENRVPMTIRTLVDLVRKVESSPSGRNMNAREIAASLLYYLRMDGIQPSPLQLNYDESIVPFAPVGDEYFKHTFMLQRLLSKPSQPNYAFLTEGLTPVEMCNLHFMLSYSIDATKRLDENCGNFQQEAYQNRGRYSRSPTLSSLRQRRSETSAEDKREAEDVKAQIENIPIQILSEMEKNTTRKAEKAPSDIKIIKADQRVVPNVERSQCPVENGVIWTPYGSVTIGTVIAGITAGLQRQYIMPKDLGVLPTEIRTELKSITIDNVWATTLAGDLADLILAVGDLGADVNSAVGLKGGFNNTNQPKWYLLQTDSPAFETDAQLRGALDGLWLGTEVYKLVQSSNNLKLSQILDMYYSQQGIIGSTAQACSRRPQFSMYADDDTFSKQLELYSIVLQKKRTNSATILNFQNLVSNTITNVKSYVPTFDSGSQCSSNNADQSSSATDYFINNLVVIDNSWPSNSLTDILLALVSKEVLATPFESNTTVMCGADGSILFHASNSLSFIRNLTSTTLNKCASGMDLSSVFYDMEVFFRNLYSKEETTGKVNKGSYVALLLPFSSSSTQNIESIWNSKNTFNTSLPDVKILVGTNGPKDSFSTIVDDYNTDLFTIPQASSTDATTFNTQIEALAKRIKTVPQHVSNPRCGSYYKELDDTVNSQGTLTDNVRLGATKYYRVHPNYFYDNTDMPIISVRSLRATSLTVCYSRTNPNPTGTAPDINQNGQTPNFNNNNNNPNYNPNSYNPNNNNPNSYNPSNNNPNNYNPNTNNYNPNYVPSNNNYNRNTYNNNNYNNNNRNNYNNQDPRSQWRPRRAYYDRQTSTDAQCVPVTQTKTSLTLPENPCSGYGYIKDCPPIFFSVSAALPTTLPPSSCLNDCRLPTNAEYEITVEQLTCTSGALDLLTNPIVVLVASLLLYITAGLI